MLLEIVLGIVYLEEILSMVICLHSAFHERIRADWKTVGLLVSNLILLESIYLLQLENVYTIAAYGIYFVYSVAKFKCGLLKSFFNVVCCVVLISSVQIIFSVLLYVFISDYEVLMAIFVNTFSLATCVLIFLRLRIDRWIALMWQKKELLCVLFVIAVLVIALLLFQTKQFGDVQMEIFVFAIPLLMILTWAIARWLIYQEDKKKLENELKIQKQYQESYNELLEKVRIRQHDFNNQITGILSTHYVYKTYDEMVKSQQEYCAELMEDNRYNRILWIGSKVLAGFLYRRFLEIEGTGIKVDYQITIYELNISVLDYQLIEMLGILLDNAVDAVKASECEKLICIEIGEGKEAYFFKIRNQSHHATYDEIETWFQYGFSHKGKGRGIGLYQVRQLCTELGCEILCENIIDNGQNWIQFTLKITKESESI